MDNLELFGFIVELVALLLFFVVVYYVYRVNLLTKGFEKTWSIIGFAFVLIIVRRGISFMLPYIEGSARSIFQNIILPFVLLFISVLFIYGFYRLDSLFEKIVRIKAGNSKKGIG